MLGNVDILLHHMKQDDDMYEFLVDIDLKHIYPNYVSLQFFVFLLLQLPIFLLQFF